MKTAQIINARQFNTVKEYTAAIGLNEFEGEWMDLARFLEVPLNPKGGRRSIADAWKSLNSGIDGTTADAPKKSVSTKVAVVQKATTVQIPVVQPEPAKQEPAKLPKIPKYIDYPQTEEGEDQFDNDMTAWVIVKKQLEANQVQQPLSAPIATVQPEPVQSVQKKAQPVVQSTPVIAPVTVDNIEETARQLAQLLAGIKPGFKSETNSDDIKKTVSEMLNEFEERIEDKYTSAVMGGLDNLLKTAKRIIAEEIIDAKNDLAGNVQTIQVKVNDSVGVKIDGLVHERFEDILRHVSVRDNVMLVGPAGSGKTTVCENVAQALALDFFCKSVCAQTSKSELLGYMDANGNFVSTEFRVAYQNGGVFVLDEIDAGNPNVIAVLNSALANNYCAFADGMIRKHDDFVLIACANTFGTGASREYVGRNQLDSATLDRFSVIEFGYDEKLENALSADKTFCKFVQAVRKELASERVVISPRASIQGGKLLAAGCTAQYVLQTRIIKGMAPALADRTRTVFARFY